MVGSRRRALAWRAGPGESPDPYRVWLSEVLLQQTTAQAATPYFLNFIAKWPRVEDLAAAPSEAVMSAFAGLGYYSRARNLHACAKEIARRGGRFPSAEADLRSLPGVGAYTAAAISAIAFGRQTAPVDGNIARILARLLAIEEPIAQAKSEIATAARALAPSKRAGDFAQALMDIGATICRPRNPDCAHCPLVQDCAAFRTAAPEAYPRRARAKVKPCREGAVFFARRSDGAFLARRRPPHGLLASTVELPGTPWTSEGSSRGVSQRGAGRRALAAAARDSRTGLHSLRAQIDGVRGSVRRRRSGGPFLGGRDAVGEAGFSNMMRKAVDHALKQE